MSNWMNNLGKWQRVAFATFFGFLGCALWVIPFLFETKNMVKGGVASWPTAYYFFLVFGTIAVGISLKLSRIDKLFNLSVGFLSKKANAKESEKN